MRRTAFIIMICISIFGFGSCKKSGSRKSDKPVFAIVANGSARFWDLACAGFKQASVEEDVLWEFHMPGQSSAAQQKQIIESVIAKGYDGMAISAINPQTMSKMIDEVAEYMPVICLDSDAPQSNRIVYVGTGNVEAGRVAGREMKKSLPQGGEIAVFVGKLDVANARERFQGVQEALEGSHCRIVELFTDQTDRTQAQANVRIALAKYPELRGIIGLWCYNGPAAVAVLADYPDHNINVVGFDEEDATLSAIRQNSMLCSVAQQPYEAGYQTIKILAKLYRGEKLCVPENKQIYIPVQVIHKENVDEFEKKMKQSIVLRNR